MSRRVSADNPSRYNSVTVSVNRLLRLSKVLDTLKDDQFDQSKWTDIEDKVFKKPLKCGMACCIGGWATTVHPHLEIYNGSLRNTQSIEGDVDAFATAFGLNEDTALLITNAGAHHRKPKDAAKVIFKLAERLAAENDLEIVNA